jgi:hypothetical protein
MALAVWGLMKSMNRQLGRVDFTEEADPKAAASEQTTGPAGSGGKASPAKG